MREKLIRRSAWLVCVALVPLVLVGARKSPLRKLSVDPAAPEYELFDAIELGLVSVRLVQNNETAGNAFFENKSGAPLTVYLPAVMAGQQVLKQLPPGNNSFFPGNQNSNSNTGAQGGAQTTGLSTGNTSQANNGNLANQFFSIPAERVVVVPVKSVCLEEGKPAPVSQMHYELRPLAEFNPDPVLAQLLTELAAKTFDAQALQAAAWHVAGKMSWETLAAKRIKHVGGGSEPYFLPAQLRTARQLVDRAENRVREQIQMRSLTAAQPRL